MHILLILIGTVCSVVGIVALITYREVKIQRDFEKQAWDKWNAMTEQERLDSGQENPFC